MKNLARSWAFLITLIAGAWGCDVSTHCDPGQIYMNYGCYSVAEAGAGGAGGGAGDGGASDAEPDGSGNTCAPFEGFGATCTMISDCPCNLDGCNTFMAANYCTHTHCVGETGTCPSGWTCIDISAFDPVTGSFCARP